MNLILRALSGGLKRYCPSTFKKAIWNQEFGEGKWKYLDRVSGNGKRDIIYALIEKYCNNGKILDLGCGTGGLGRFLNPEKYKLYVGVDISDVAIHAARMGCAADPIRTCKHYFTACDIKHYLPDTMYDVILFVESLYYIDRPSLLKVLNHYLGYLTEPEGVMIARVHDRNKYTALIERIYKYYQVLEQHTSRNGRCSIVFRKSESRAPNG